MNEHRPGTWTTQEFELGYLCAFAALGISPDMSVGRQLAEATRTLGELMGAIKAMRAAPQHQRVFAALDALKSYHAGVSP